jgi:hypothetical protein
MAYVSKDLKAKLAPAIKAICVKYGVKASLAVKNNSTLVLNIKSGKVNFFADVADAYHEGKETREYFQLHDNSYKHFSNISSAFLREISEAMNIGNYDDSDIMTDYFSVGWYTRINVGQCDSPYIYQE